MKMKTIGVALVTTFALSQPAYAYVDPGSASVVIAAVLGSIAAVGYTIRTFLARVKSFFAKNKKPEER